MSVTTQTRQLPIVVCAGSGRERGRAHGEALRATIQRTVGAWTETISLREGVPAETYFARFLRSTNFVPAIERYTPGLLDEVRGIAEGADMPFDTIFSYNLMDEEWTFSRAEEPEPGCTVACLLKGGRDVPVLAQTMDIPTVHDGSQAVLHLMPDDGPEALVFTGAGMIALNGANAAGVGVVVNNLSMLPSSTSGLPVMFVIRGVLQRRSMAEAAAFVESVPHAIGQHYAIAGPDGIASIEGAANGAIRDLRVTDGFVHTNHPVVNMAVEGDPAVTYQRSRTFERFDRAAELRANAGDQSDIEALLTDRTVPISILPSASYMTFGATSIECTVPPVVHIAPGPPHETPYVPVAWA